MQVAVVYLTFIVSVVTALFVYLKSPRNATHVYFAMLVTFIGAYPIFNYLALHSASDSEALFWAKLILLVSIPQGPLLYFFAKTFPKPNFVFRIRQQAFIVIWVILNIALALQGLIFKHVSIENGVANIQPGLLVPSFGLLHVSTIVGGLVVLFLKYAHNKGRARRQLALIFYGILVSFSLTFVITFILPLFLNNTVLLAISPLSLVFAVLVAAYAIVTQKLFDIRPAVARSVAYVLSISFIGLVYGSIIVGLSSLDMFNHQSILTQRIEYVGFALATALFYPRIKQFFARVTNRVLYQDAYDTEQLFNALNRVLAANIELDKLLSDSLAVISNNFKSEFTAIALKMPGREHRHIVGALSRNFDESVLDLVHEKQITENYAPVVATEQLVEEGNRELIRALRKSDIEVLADLGFRARLRHTTLGCIVLGPRKSGLSYDSQDLDVLEAIANEMVIAVQNALRFEEIKRFNETLQDEVDSATYRLRKTNKRLEELDDIKDDFISMASHQLRTPLTSVKGYLSMVLEGDAGTINQQQAKMLGQAFTSAQRMVFLITDLLNVSRLKTGKFIIDASPVDLSTMIQEEVDQLRETAEVKGLKMKYKKPKSFPKLMLDEVKIRQVAMNFMDNAIYYTPPGGHITVELVDKPAAVELRVVDDGIGVPRGEQHHLFTKFYRATNARKARPDGTGLGLFMAAKVIVAQGGSIIFSSKEGKGSTFGFRLSKARLAIKDTNTPAGVPVASNQSS